MKEKFESQQNPPVYCVVSFTQDEIDFLLYTLGFLRGLSDDMNAAHQSYIRKHHDTVLPKLIASK